MNDAIKTERFLIPLKWNRIGVTRRLGRIKSRGNVRTQNHCELKEEMVQGGQEERDSSTFDWGCDSGGTEARGGDCQPLCGPECAVEVAAAQALDVGKWKGAPCWVLANERAKHISRSGKCPHVVAQHVPVFELPGEQIAASRLFQMAKHLLE